MKKQSIQRIKREIRAHANVSTVFVDINGNEVAIRSVLGVIVLGYEGGEKEQLLQTIGQMKSKRIIKTIL